MKVILDVPFADKQSARSLGARYMDPQNKDWRMYAPNPIVLQRCLEWAPAGTQVPTHLKWQDYSYEQRAEAKEAGCKWDPDFSCWYQPKE